jgi:hypothetical protein
MQSPLRLLWPLYYAALCSTVQSQCALETVGVQRRRYSNNECPRYLYPAKVPVSYFLLTSFVGEIEEVRRLDRVATQCWFKDSHFQDVLLPEQTSTISTCIIACWDAIISKTELSRSKVSGVSILEESVQPILDLKQLLMVSAYEHRIHFILPE